MLSREAFMGVIAMIGLLGLLGAESTATEANGLGAGLTPAYGWLDKSPLGKSILENAQKQNVPIKEGRVSKTEMTATRTTEGSGEERYQYSIQVVIARDKDAVFQALDLAHELTHAIHSDTNPFDPHLSAEEYVKHGIEGDGGEAQAILQECRVGKELLTQLKEETASLVKARCQFVWRNEDNDVKWKSSFYHVGQYYHDFMKMVGQLKSDIKVESKSPMFASAVTHKPYPLALLEEYIQVTQKICEKPSTGRSIASLDLRCQAVQNIVR